VGLPSSWIIVLKRFLEQLLTHEYLLFILLGMFFLLLLWELSMLWLVLVGS